MSVAADFQLYRYTVRCDRERFSEIEKQARACGMSAGELVQMHFEGILDDVRKAEEPARLPRPKPSRVEVEAASKLGLSVGALRVFRVVEAVADEHDRSEIGVGAIAQKTGLPNGSVRTILIRLVQQGWLSRVSASGWRRTTIYRVHEPEAGADGE